jgi:hypothetical protein
MSPFKTVRQFRCTNCGGEITLINARTRYVGCQYCGAVADARSEAHEVITQLNKPSQFPPRSFVKLGMTAVFDGVKHQVLGRTCWKSTYKEYWSEDGESGYSDETWTYDEWVLMSEHRTFFYLIEDNEGYAISQPIVPANPNIPAQSSNKMRNFFTNASEQIQEHGHSEVTHFEGESTYLIRLRDKVHFAEYRRTRSHIVETRLDKNAQPKEIEFFVETPVTRNDLLKAFAGNPEADAILQRRAENRVNAKFWQRVFGVASLVFFVLFVYSLGLGRQVHTQSFSVPMAPDSNAISDTPQLLAMVRPFELQPGVVRMVMSAAMPDNSDTWVGLELRDQKGEVANVLEDTFFQESGTEYWQEDGESGWESWEESEREKEQYYRVDEPGVYAGKLYVIPNPKGDTKIELAVHQVNMLSRYYLTAFLACLLMFFVATLAVFAYR